jgi:mRNA turnover protein 4
LTKTEKHGKEHKESLINQLHEACDAYNHIYTFKVSNMRNVFLKEIREEWKGKGRIVMGKNRVMQAALGKGEETAYLPNLHEMDVSGSIGLLFTNAEPEEVCAYFDAFERKDYARGGSKAAYSVVLPEGQVMLGPDEFPPSMETQLRKLGVPSILKAGKVILNGEYTICKEGETLNHEQAKLLKMFYHEMAVFKVTVLQHYTAGSVETINEQTAEDRAVQSEMIIEQ